MADPISTINIFVFQLIKQIASMPLTQVMVYLSASFVIILPLIAIYFYIKKEKNLFIFAIAFFLLYIISDILKLIIKEPRPCTLPSLSWINSAGCEATFGFPSSHATSLTGLVFFMDSYEYLRVLFIAWVILVLFSRVYLGLHYFTDVLAGAAISLIVARFLYVYKDKINTKMLSIAKKLIPMAFNHWK